MRIDVHHQATVKDQDSNRVSDFVQGVPKQLSAVSAIVMIPSVQIPLYVRVERREHVGFISYRPNYQTVILWLYVYQYQ